MSMEKSLLLMMALTARKRNKMNRNGLLSQFSKAVMMKTRRKREKRETL